MSTLLKPSTVKNRLSSSKALIESLKAESAVLEALPPMLEVLYVTASRTAEHAHRISLPFCNEDTFNKLPAVPLHNLPAGITFTGLKPGALVRSTNSCRVLDVIRDLNGGCRWFTTLAGNLVEVGAVATSLDFSAYEEAKIEGTSLAYYRQFLVGSKQKKKVAVDVREPLAAYEDAKVLAREQLRKKYPTLSFRCVQSFNVLAASRFRNGTALPEHVKRIVASHNLPTPVLDVVKADVAALPSMSLVDQDAYVVKELLRAQKWVRSFFRNVCTSQRNALDILALNKLMSARLNIAVDLSIVSKAQRGATMAYEYTIGFHFRSKYSSISVKVERETPGFPAFCWVTLAMAK